MFPSLLPCLSSRLQPATCRVSLLLEGVRRRLVPQLAGQMRQVSFGVLVCPKFPYQTGAPEFSHSKFPRGRAVPCQRVTGGLSCCAHGAASRPRHSTSIPNASHQAVDVPVSVGSPCFEKRLVTLYLRNQARTTSKYLIM